MPAWQADCLTGLCLILHQIERFPFLNLVYTCLVYTACRLSPDATLVNKLSFEIMVDLEQKDE